MTPGHDHRRSGRTRPRLATTSLVALVLATATMTSAAAATPRSITYRTNTTLRANVTCANLTVAPGVTLTTNGYAIDCTGIFTNDGVVRTGYSPAAARPASYGGSGGGATNTGPGGAPGDGLRTRTPGGRACATNGCRPGNGASPTAPPLTAALVARWRNGLAPADLSGADGGTSGKLARGRGAEGLVVTAARIIGGVIDADGTNGSTKGATEATGGGGGGVVVLSYGGGGFVGGHYDVAGGSATLAGKKVGVGGRGAVYLLGPTTTTSAPSSVTVDAGATATFTATASGGSPTPTVRWQRSPNGVAWTNVGDGPVGDGSTATGATTGTLAISNAQPDETGLQFRAAFTNAVGTVDAGAATLTVHWNDGGAAPTDQAVLVGGSATFSTAPHSANPTPTVHWQESAAPTGPWTSVFNGTEPDGSSISGASSTTLEVDNAQPDENATEYRAAFTNAAGTVASAAGVLTVEFNGGGSAPDSTTAEAGSAASFTSTPLGAEPAATEQWQVSVDGGTDWTTLVGGTLTDGSVASGVTTPTLSISNLQPDEDNNEYRAAFTNAAGTRDSPTAVLTVQYNLGGTAPSDQTVDAGQTATFSTGPAGADPAATVTWQVSANGGGGWSDLADGTEADSSVVSGATTTTLTISDVAVDENGEEFRAAYTNVAGTVDTTGGSLTVQYNDGGTTPAPETVDASTTATFSSTASAANPTATVRWQLSSNDGSTWSALSDGSQSDTSVVSGATTGTLAVANVEPDETGDEFRAAYTNVAGTVDTGAATLTVQYNDGASAPDDQTVTVGQSANFTSTSSGGSPPPTVRWQESASASGPWTALSDGTQGDGSVVSGSATTTLTIANTAVDEDRAWVRATFTNTAGTVDSSSAELVVEYNEGGATPSNQAAVLNASVTFTTSSLGADPAATVQWQLSSNDGSTWADLTNGAVGDGSTVTGATTDAVTIADVQVDENGDLLRATFTNVAAVVETATAALTVEYNLGGSAPGGQTADAGSSATFTSTSSGASPTPTVQWQVSTNGGGSWTALANGTRGDGSVVTGATSTTLTISNLQADEDGDAVRALFANAAGSVASPAATLVVQYNLGGSAPQSTTVALGGTATFTSTANGADPAATVRWQVSTNDGASFSALTDGPLGDGSTISGSTTGTLTITDVQTDETADLYRALYSNAAGAVPTAAATLTDAWNDGATAPQSAVAAAGGTVQFTSSSTGANPAPTIQWQILASGQTSWATLANGTDVTGATTTTVSVTVVSADDNAQYRAVFTNIAGSVDSAAATLQIPETSSNWSGYVDSTGANDAFTGLSGTFTVPTLACTSAATDAAIWVGIDGFNNSTVEQDGVEAVCSGGAASYQAWYELYGDDAVNGGAEVGLSTSTYPVAAGDVVTAGVTVTGNDWVFSISDDSTAHASWSWSDATTPISFSGGAEASAEWIVERPEECTGNSCAITSLADFGTVTFTAASVTLAGGATGSISAAADIPLYMASGHTTYSTVGPLSDGGTEFTDTWVHS